VQTPLQRMIITRNEQAKSSSPLVDYLFSRVLLPGDTEARGAQASSSYTKTKTFINVPKLHTLGAKVPRTADRSSAGGETIVGLATRRSWPAHGTVCKEADRFAVGGVDGDLDVSFLLRSVEDAGGLVAGELGAWGRWTRRGRSFRYRPPLSHYRLTHLGSSSIFPPCAALKRGEDLTLGVLSFLVSTNSVLRGPHVNPLSVDLRYRAHVVF
jgi:hypothetical protein